MGTALEPCAWAESADDRNVARSFAEKGFELFEQGEAEKAIQSFQKAEQRVHSPVHLLYIARAQAVLGKLLEAIQTYEKILKEKLPPDAPPPFAEARVDAAKEAKALKERTPAVKIVLSGVPPEKAAVKLDGVLLTAAQLGVPIQANPGTHTIVATFQDAGEVQRTIQLSDAPYVQSVDIQVESAGVSIPTVAAFSLGGIGLVVGTATGVAYLGKETPNKALGAVSLAGLITGGIGLITGTVLVVLNSNDANDEGVADSRGRPSLYARIGPASLHVGGTF